MSSRFRRGGDRGGWTGDTPFAGPPALVCPSCGLRNDPSARFCRNCGLPLGWPEDPVRGTTTRQADLPSNRGAGVASIIGLLAAVAVLVVAGFLVLRGSGGSGTVSPSHSPSSRPSVGLLSPGPSGSGLTPTTGVATPPPSGTTDTPSPAVTEPPGSFPATIGFSCDPGTIADASLTRWKVARISSKSYSISGFDRVILDLSSQGTTNREATISVESLTLAQVSSRYGLNAPQNADHAVVVTFEHRVIGFKQSPVTTGMKVVPNLSMGLGSDGLWHVVLGVVGNGCHRIGVPVWDSDPTATSAQLNIDVKK